MALQGNHRCVSIPDLFGFLQMHRLTGVLVVASPARDRSFFFQEGEIAYALINDPGQIFGAVLVRELDLDSELVEQVLQELDGNRYLGEELARRGLLEEQAVHDVVARQVRRALREVLRWNEWAFHFQDVDEDRHLPKLRISTQSLVFDLTRELDEWNSIEEIFPDLECVLERNPGSVVFPQHDDWDPHIPPAGRLLSEIDGQRSVRLLLEESAYPVLAHSKALATMFHDGLVRVNEEPPFEIREGNYSPSVLPVIPNLPARIFSILNSSTGDIQELENLLLCDPVLTARILRVAALRRQDRDDPLVFSDLVRRIGRASLESILLAEAVRGLFLSPNRFTWYRFWEDTYRASKACRRIAELCQYPDPDLAQAAGLLQDIGCLVLAAQSPDRYRRVCDLYLAGGKTLIEAEEEVFRTNHLKVGSQLAEAWGFPSSLRVVIREHHSALEHPRNLLLGIVRLANSIVSCDSPIQSEGVPRGVLKRTQRRLGIHASALDVIKKQTHQQGQQLDLVGELA